MTPAVQALKRAKIDFQLHHYEHDANARSFGGEVADKLDLDPNAAFKTLVACDEHNPRKMVVAVVPVAGHLDLKKLAKASGIKKMKMADSIIAEKTTGYVTGGISPLGQKKRLPTFLDCSAQKLDVIYISGGKRGLTLEVAPGPVLELLGGHFVDIAAA
ncbi:MAG: Cys-tRNA(Pro)/Cys-tRNA(Cys) deacylase YbaK [Candidatus Celerinatantimonas neptuna]|nr:MAG: Cys-tRNA(Pro)/Cys-tRNA(Cys) deacylase YbaK [Candidatus Celerinatantimonas neptuna]